MKLPFDLDAIEAVRPGTLSTSRARLAWSEDFVELARLDDKDAPALVITAEEPALVLQLSRSLQWRSPNWFQRLVGVRSQLVEECLHLELRTPRLRIKLSSIVPPQKASELAGLPELEGDGESVPFKSVLELMKACGALGARVAHARGRSEEDDEKAFTEAEALAELEQRNDGLQAELETLRRRFDDAESGEGADPKTLNALEARNQSLLQEVESLNARLTEARENVAREIEREKNKISKRLAKHKARARKLERELEQAHTAAAQRLRGERSEVERIEAERFELERQLDRMRRQLDRVHKRLRQHKGSRRPGALHPEVHDPLMTPELFSDWIERFSGSEAMLLEDFETIWFGAVARFTKPQRMRTVEQLDERITRESLRYQLNALCEALRV